MSREIECKDCGGTGMVSLGDGIRGVRKCDKCSGGVITEASGSAVVGFKRLSDNATIPNRAHATDAGFDLYASDDVIIEPRETAVVSTGIAVRLPKGMEAQVRPRSGVTSKTKLRVQLGTIDNGYSGEIGVIVDNIRASFYGDDDLLFSPWNIEEEVEVGRGHFEYGSYIIRKGDRIAQLVVQELPPTQAIEIDSLEDTERGAGGFGSSGYAADSWIGQCTKNTGREFD